MRLKSRECVNKWRRRQPSKTANLKNKFNKLMPRTMQINNRIWIKFQLQEAEIMMLRA
jgi:hypothetical protein